MERLVGARHQGIPQSSAEEGACWMQEKGIYRALPIDS